MYFQFELDIINVTILYGPLKGSINQLLALNVLTLKIGIMFLHVS